MEKSIVEQIEDAIVLRLQRIKAADGFEVQLLPELEAELLRTVDTARISVCYQASLIDPTGTGMTLPATSMSDGSQEETQHYKINVQSKRLRGELGVFPLIQIVRALLVGYEPAGADPLRVLNIHFKEFTENTWSYDIMLGTRVPFVPTFDDVDEVNITEIIRDEVYPESLPT